MVISLDERTAETVKVYFERAQHPLIRAMLPQKAQSVEEALDDYRKTLRPTATSFGRIIRMDGNYVGDVWCYCIDKAEAPNAMLSYCVFDASCWNRGIATKAVSLFLEEARARYALRTIGAFTFSENRASCTVLEKNGFTCLEEFVENGKASKYYQRSF